jgi:hypothetical protein
VLIIDNSGSMRTADVKHDGGMIQRQAAVYSAIRESLLEPQLSFGVGQYDLVSLILFDSGACIQLFHVSFQEAIQGIEYLQWACPPRGHGCYLPALGALASVLDQPFPVGLLGAVNVLFFSDGRPSDSVPGGIDGFVGNLASIMVDTCGETVQQFPETFAFHAIGCVHGLNPRPSLQSLTTSFSLARARADLVKGSL